MGLCMPAAIRSEEAEFEAVQEASPEKSPDELSVEREIGIYIISDTEER